MDAAHRIAAPQFLPPPVPSVVQTTYRAQFLRGERDHGISPRLAVYGTFVAVLEAFWVSRLGTPAVAGVSLVLPALWMGIFSEGLRRTR